MSGAHPHQGSGEMVYALGIYEILCEVFELNRDVRQRRILSHKDLFCCALVSRSFCEPALRVLWRTMSPPTPLWRLLADPNATLQEFNESDFLDTVSNLNCDGLIILGLIMLRSQVMSEKTYADPARWGRLVWYACLVQELDISAPFCTPDKHTQLIDALVSYNGGVSIFPSLRALRWPASSYSDSSYFPLFTPRLQSAIFKFPHSLEADISDIEEDPQSHIFLAPLRTSSPRLGYLCIDACCAHIGANSSRIISSFEHLARVNIVASISFASFRELATMPSVEFLRISQVRSNAEQEPSHPEIHSPTLTQISVGGNCSSLTQLFTALRAPILTSVGLHAIVDDPEADGYIDYESSITALSTACSPTTMTDIWISLDENAYGPTSSTYLYDLVSPLLVFTNSNVERFSMSCPMLELVADDDDFYVFTLAWRKLRTFELSQAYWYSYPYVDEDEGFRMHVPTPELLESFRQLSGPPGTRAAPSRLERQRVAAPHPKGRSAPWSEAPFFLSEGFRQKGGCR